MHSFDGGTIARVGLRSEGYWRWFGTWRCLAKGKRVWWRRV